ncbi:MAG: mechanosensitive ion channel family protein [Ruminococcaceae bacterium]|jgi:small conductance mechanosensitive channel|nr:mechanosensitive ion channel family protein [Oscillospiraceae bacterium]
MDTVAMDPNTVTQEAVDALKSLAEMPGTTRWDYLWDGFIKLLPKLFTAAGILIIGIILIRLLLRLTRKMLQKSKLDPTLHHFMLSIFGICLYLVLGTMVLATLVPDAVGGLIALMSVFGLAISLAVKDSLANLAGGISVLFTKPFALGDYVQINSTEGTVEEIRLNYTVLKTFDNKVVHIPNGDVAKAQIVNFTCEPTRRLDITFSISYYDDFQKAQELIQTAASAHPMALDDPEPSVRVSEYASSAMLICCRVWCKTPDYWTLKFDLLEEVKRIFDQNGITIPHDQLDVHIAE